MLAQSIRTPQSDNGVLPPVCGTDHRRGVGRVIPRRCRPQALASRLVAVVRTFTVMDPDPRHSSALYSRLYPGLSVDAGQLYHYRLSRSTVISSCKALEHACMCSLQSKAQYSLERIHLSSSAPPLYKHQQEDPSMWKKNFSHTQKETRRATTSLLPQQFTPLHGRAESCPGGGGASQAEPPPTREGADRQQDQPPPPPLHQQEAGRELLLAALLPVPQGARQGQGYLHVQVEYTYSCHCRCRRASLIK
jgi:hypothetical protein